MKNFIKFTISNIKYLNSSVISFPYQLTVAVNSVPQEIAKITGKEEKIQKTLFYNYESDLLQIEVTASKTTLFIFSSVMAKSTFTVNLNKFNSSVQLLVLKSVNKPEDLIHISYSICYDREDPRIDTQSGAPNRLFNVGSNSKNDISVDKIDLVSRKKLFTNLIQEKPEPSSKADAALNKTVMDYDTYHKKVDRATNLGNSHSNNMMMRITSNEIEDSIDSGHGKDSTVMLTQQQTCESPNHRQTQNVSIKEADILENLEDFFDQNYSQLILNEKNEESSKAGFKMLIKRVYSILKEEESKNNKLKSELKQTDLKLKQRKEYLMKEKEKYDQKVSQLKSKGGQEQPSSISAKEAELQKIMEDQILLINEIKEQRNEHSLRYLNRQINTAISLGLRDTNLVSKSILSFEVQENPREDYQESQQKYSISFTKAAASKLQDSILSSGVNNFEMNNTSNFGRSDLSTKKVHSDLSNYPMGEYSKEKMVSIQMPGNLNSNKKNYYSKLNDIIYENQTDEMSKFYSNTNTTNNSLMNSTVAEKPKESSQGKAKRVNSSARDDSLQQNINNRYSNQSINNSHSSSNNKHVNSQSGNKFYTQNTEINLAPKDNEPHQTKKTTSNLQKDQLNTNTLLDSLEGLTDKTPIKNKNKFLTKCNVASNPQIMNVNTYQAQQFTNQNGKVVIQTTKKDPVIAKDNDLRKALADPFAKSGKMLGQVLTSRAAYPISQTVSTNYSSTGNTSLKKTK